LYCYDVSCCRQKAWLHAKRKRVSTFRLRSILALVNRWSLSERVLLRANSFMRQFERKTCNRRRNEECWVDTSISTQDPRFSDGPWRAFASQVWTQPRWPQYLIAPLVLGQEIQPPGKGCHLWPRLTFVEWRVRDRFVSQVARPHPD